MWSTDRVLPVVFHIMSVSCPSCSSLVSKVPAREPLPAPLGSSRHRLFPPPGARPHNQVPTVHQMMSAIVCWPSTITARRADSPKAIRGTDPHISGTLWRLSVRICGMHRNTLACLPLPNARRQLVFFRFCPSIGHEIGFFSQ